MEGRGGKGEGRGGQRGRSSFTCQPFDCIIKQLVHETKRGGEGEGGECCTGSGIWGSNEV